MKSLLGFKSAEMFEGIDHGEEVHGEGLCLGYPPEIDFHFLDLVGYKRGEQAGKEGGRECFKHSLTHALSDKQRLIDAKLCSPHAVGSEKLIGVDKACLFEEGEMMEEVKPEPMPGPGDFLGEFA
jgi:hypothetical protein